MKIVNKTNNPSAVWWRLTSGDTCFWSQGEIRQIIRNTSTTRQKKEFLHIWYFKYLPEMTSFPFQWRNLWIHPEDWPQRTSCCAKNTQFLLPKGMDAFPICISINFPGYSQIKWNTRHSNYCCRFCFLRSFSKSHLSFPPHLSSFACRESETKACTSLYTLSVASPFALASEQ